MTDPGFEHFVEAIEATLHDLGVPGIVSSPRDVRRLEALYDAGADLDTVQRAMVEAAARRLRAAKEVRGLRDLMPGIRAALKRAGVVAARPRGPS